MALKCEDHYKNQLTSSKLVPPMKDQNWSQKFVAKEDSRLLEDPHLHQTNHCWACYPDENQQSSEEVCSNAVLNNHTPIQFRVCCPEQKSAEWSERNIRRTSEHFQWRYFIEYIWRKLNWTQTWDKLFFIKRTSKFTSEWIITTTFFTSWSLFNVLAIKKSFL